MGSKAGPLMLLTLMKAQTPRRNDALAKKNCLALMLPIPPLALLADDGSVALHMLILLSFVKECNRQQSNNFSQIQIENFCEV